MDSSRDQSQHIQNLEKELEALLQNNALSPDISSKWELYFSYLSFNIDHIIQECHIILDSKADNHHILAPQNIQCTKGNEILPYDAFDVFSEALCSQISIYSSHRDKFISHFPYIGPLIHKMSIEYVSQFIYAYISIFSHHKSSSSHTSILSLCRSRFPGLFNETVLTSILWWISTFYIYVPSLFDLPGTNTLDYSLSKQQPFDDSPSRPLPQSLFHSLYIPFFHSCIISAIPGNQFIFMTVSYYLYIQSVHKSSQQLSSSSSSTSPTVTPICAGVFLYPYVTSELPSFDRLKFPCISNEASLPLSSSSLSLPSSCIDTFHTSFLTTNQYYSDLCTPLSSSLSPLSPSDSASNNHRSEPLDTGLKPPPDEENDHLSPLYHHPSCCYNTTIDTSDLTSSSYLASLDEYYNQYRTGSLFVDLIHGSTGYNIVQYINQPSELLSFIDNHNNNYNNNNNYYNGSGPLNSSHIKHHDRNITTTITNNNSNNNNNHIIIRSKPDNYQCNCLCYIYHTTDIITKLSSPSLDYNTTSNHMLSPSLSSSLSPHIPTPHLPTQLPCIDFDLTFLSHYIHISTSFFSSDNPSSIMDHIIIRSRLIQGYLSLVSLSYTPQFLQSQCRLLSSSFPGNEPLDMYNELINLIYFHTIHATTLLSPTSSPPTSQTSSQSYSLSFTPRDTILSCFQDDNGGYNLWLFSLVHCGIYDTLTSPHMLRLLHYYTRICHKFSLEYISSTHVSILLPFIPESQSVKQASDEPSSSSSSSSLFSNLPLHLQDLYTHYSYTLSLWLSFIISSFHLKPILYLHQADYVRFMHAGGDINSISKHIPIILTSLWDTIQPNVSQSDSNTILPSLTASTAILQDSHILYYNNLSLKYYIRYGISYTSHIHYTNDIIPIDVPALSSTKKKTVVSSKKSTKKAFPTSSYYRSSVVAYLVAFSTLLTTSLPLSIDQQQPDDQQSHQCNNNNNNMYQISTDLFIYTMRLMRIADMSYIHLHTLPIYDLYISLSDNIKHKDTCTSKDTILSLYTHTISTLTVVLSLCIDTIHRIIQNGFKMRLQTSYLTSQHHTAVVPSKLCDTVSLLLQQLSPSSSSSSLDNMLSDDPISCISTNNGSNIPYHTALELILSPNTGILPLLLPPNKTIQHSLLPLHYTYIAQVSTSSDESTHDIYPPLIYYDTSSRYKLLRIYPHIYAQDWARQTEYPLFLRFIIDSNVITFISKTIQNGITSILQVYDHVNTIAPTTNSNNTINTNTIYSVPQHSPFNLVWTYLPHHIKTITTLLYIIRLHNKMFCLYDTSTNNATTPSLCTISQMMSSIGNRIQIDPIVSYTEKYTQQIPPASSSPHHITYLTSTTLVNTLIHMTSIRSNSAPQYL